MAIRAALIALTLAVGGGFAKAQDTGGAATPGSGVGAVTPGPLLQDAAPTAPQAEWRPGAPTAMPALVQRAAPANESTSQPAPPSPAQPLSELPPAGLAPSAPADVTPDAASTLPRNLSPWGMFMAADWVVKAVMIGLAVASVVTWTVWLAKSFELARARLSARRGLRELTGAADLQQAAARLPGGKGVVTRLVDAALAEVEQSTDLVREGFVGGAKERVAARLGRIEAAGGRGMTRGTGVLATIGATAPFVGLFGTVWGIMNAFIGISEAQTTNLAVVAPGIAEALLATALGLVAAIPAVVIYNMFARAIGGYRALLADASTEVQRLTSRDLDRRTLPMKRREAAE